MQAHTTAVVEAHEIRRDFRAGRGIVHALRGITLQIQPGAFVALRGRSGSGKTTLLNILTGLDDPTQGRVLLLGHALAALDESERATLRRTGVGMLFQQAHLFPALTAQENVEIPLRLALVEAKERERRGREALEQVALSHRAHHRALELSGGEQQRVALARALVHRPRLLVADEPTGNLDAQTGHTITLLLRTVAHQEDLGLLVATHDAAVVEAADRVLSMQDGQITPE